MRHFVFAALGLAACTSPTSTTSPTTPTESAPVATSNTYPLTFPVLDEGELSRRTTELEKQNPDWDITLDPLGFLSSAVCKCGHAGDFKKPGPTPLSQLDREKIEAFIEKNDAILHLKGPGAKKKYENERSIFWQQLGPRGTMGFVRIDADHLGARISGHLWPAMAPAGETKPDAELERLVRALDTSPDIDITRTYRYAAKTVQGPLEIHEVACAHNAGDDLITDYKQRPHRPCVDARTGQDLSKDAVGMTISSKNGVVTERRLTKD